MANFRDVEISMRIASNGLIALLLSVFCSLPDTAIAQQLVKGAPQTTMPPADARYEILQSPLAARWTFRLDRYTGRVYQLVKMQEGGAAWEPMLVEGIPEISRPDRPRFVIFTSGLAARHTFLMDSDTGQTWMLGTVTSSEDEIAGWWRFKW